MTNHNFTKVYDYYKKTNTYCGLPKNSPVYLNLSETKEEQNKNLYSVMPESYYGKQFHVSQLFARNELIAKYCDKMIAFIHSNSATSGSEHAVKMAQKHKKPVVIINEL
jgi:hypothetical protein